MYTVCLYVCIKKYIRERHQQLINISILLITRVTDYHPQHHLLNNLFTTQQLFLTSAIEFSNNFIKTLE